MCMGDPENKKPTIFRQWVFKFWLEEKNSLRIARIEIERPKQHTFVRRMAA